MHFITSISRVKSSYVIYHSKLIHCFHYTGNLRTHYSLFTSVDAGHLGASLSKWYIEYNMDG